MEKPIEEKKTSFDFISVWKENPVSVLKETLISFNYIVDVDVVEDVSQI